MSGVRRRSTAGHGARVRNLFVENALCRGAPGSRRDHHEEEGGKAVSSEPSENLG